MGRRETTIFALASLVVVFITRFTRDLTSLRRRAFEEIIMMEQQQQPSTTTNNNMLQHTRSVTSATAEKKRIAIVSGFVNRPPANGSPAPRIKDTLMDHMLNKVCYANLHGYDFIFNSTWGFSQNTTGKHWLEYGTWHRVPHMMAAMDQGYEWVLYADTDYVIQDMGLPLEAFFKEWNLYGLNNVHVFVPTDGFPYFTFSAFAVLIRNSPFGRRVLENWMELAGGLCPKGNFESVPGKYSWTDSDQPGLWYALAKTHAEFHDGEYNIKCNNETGLIETKRVLGPELNAYFDSIRATRGTNRNQLQTTQKDQPIIWSTTDETGRGGLGIQQTFGDMTKVDRKQWFALHRKVNLTEDMKIDLKSCVEHRKCYARYSKSGHFEHGCDYTSPRL